MNFSALAVVTLAFVVPAAAQPTLPQELWEFEVKISRHNDDPRARRVSPRLWPTLFSGARFLRQTPEGTSIVAFDRPRGRGIEDLSELGWLEVVSAPRLSRQPAPGGFMVVLGDAVTEFPEELVELLGESARYKPRLNVVALEGAVDRQTLESLLALGEVQYIEPKSVYSAQSICTPAQDCMDVESLVSEWNLEHIRKPLQFAAVAGEPAVVAVVDSGVFYTHPALATSHWKNEAEVNGVSGQDDDGNGYDDDFHGWNFVQPGQDPIDERGHGTAMAGIVAAIAEDAKIMAVRVLQGAKLEADTEDLADAVDYATASGADIILCSWGSPEDSEALRRAFDRAFEKGVLIVAAAGNGGEDGEGDDLMSKPFYPACFDNENLVSVCSVTDGGGFFSESLSQFSNHGILQVDLAAPGQPIRTTALAPVCYGMTKGTSVAAAHVAGAAALAWNKLERKWMRVKGEMLCCARKEPYLVCRCVTQGTLDLGFLSDQCGPVGNVLVAPTDVLWHEDTVIESPEDVSVDGILTSVMAAGGETTGIALELPNGKRAELDVSTPELRGLLEDLRGSRVRARGVLETAEGVETGKRFVLRVLDLEKLPNR